MPSHKQTKRSPYSAKEIFHIVKDIESYPQFIPWISGAKIVSEKDGVLEARLDVRFKAIKTHYVSRVEMLEDEEKGVYEVNVTLVRGPFKKMINQWRLTQVEGGCSIFFFVDFVFNSLLLEKAMGLVFQKAVKDMTGCFEKRAVEHYGKR